MYIKFEIYIFVNELNVKVNLINEELQCLVYRWFYRELYNNTKNYNFKMIYLNKDDIYKKKWDFKTEFLLEKHRRKNKDNSKKPIIMKSRLMSRIIIPIIIYTQHLIKMIV